MTPVQHATQEAWTAMRRTNMPPNIALDMIQDAGSDFDDAQDALVDHVIDWLAAQWPAPPKASGLLASRYIKAAQLAASATCEILHARGFETAPLMLGEVETELDRIRRAQHRESTFVQRARDWVELAVQVIDICREISAIQPGE